MPVTAPIDRFAVSVGWRIPGRDARLLYAFAHAEQSSSLDLRVAAAECVSPSRRAQYLRHARDEARHGELFAARSAALRTARGQAPFPPVRADFEELFTRLGEVRFLAFVARGEGRAQHRLAAHRDWLAAHGRGEDAALLTTILADEAHHERYARALLVELAGSEEAARSALRKAAWWEAWRTFRRSGRWVADGTYTVLMHLLYFLCLPFAVLVWLVRPARTGWLERAGRSGAP